jgi:hypothetical protein
MTNAGIVFLVCSVAFWHALRILDRIFPRRREPIRGPWGRVVNETIKKYIRDREVSLLRSRKLVGMLKRGTGARTFTIRAAPPHLLVRLHTANRKLADLNLQDGRCGFNAADHIHYVQMTGRGTRPPDVQQYEAYARELMADMEDFYFETLYGDPEKRP